MSRRPGEDPYSPGHVKQHALARAPQNSRDRISSSSTSLFRYLTYSQFIPTSHRNPSDERTRRYTAIMVQYEKHESMELRPMPNYWKLQYRQLSTREMMRDELEASGAMGDHKVPKSLPLSELRKLLSRMNRGLMLYGKRPIQGNHCRPATIP